MKTHKLQPQRVGQKWPTPWATLGQPGPLLAQTTERDFESPIFKASQVPFSLTRYETPFCPKNKGKTQPAAQLRGVWKKFEASWAETSPLGQITHGTGHRKPAFRGLRSGAQLGDRLKRAVGYGLRVAVLSGLLLPPPAAHADGWSTGNSFDVDEASEMRKKLSKRAPPAVARAAVPPAGQWSSLGSAGRSTDWTALDEFERSTPGKRPPNLSTFRLPSGSRVEKLFALISFAESPKAGYDAIHNSARRVTSKRPTQMTFGEIKAWIRATPGQHHAIGRYQVIPSTLVELQRRLRLSDAVVYSRATQDRLAALLLTDAGYQDFMAGEITRSRFMDNLAWIWAGLPLATGKSAYHGYAGNRATVTRSFFDRQMVAIFSADAVAGTKSASRTPRRRDRQTASGWSALRGGQSSMDR